MDSPELSDPKERFALAEPELHWPHVSIHDVPQSHHADVLVLHDVAVKHAHASIIDDRHQDAGAAHFGDQHHVFPGRCFSVKGGIGTVAAGY